MKDIELLDGKLMFHSYKALKTYCDNPDNPLDVVVLGKEIDSLHRLFYSSSRTNEQFAGIENWDVSNVKDMSGMFCFAENFNQPLNNWDLSRDPDGAEDLEKYRQSKGQVVEQKKKSVHR